MFVFIPRKIRELYVFMQEVKAEGLKVSWPAPREVVQVTLVVGVMILISSAILWGMDSIILKAIKLLAKRAV